MKLKGSTELTPARFDALRGFCAAQDFFDGKALRKYCPICGPLQLLTNAHALAHFELACRSKGYPGRNYQFHLDSTT